ncbi:hypothetical protein MYA_2691 [Burkholderia sp. KJ006]|nr:hypothetical protein MYA_2691 [Burkholderia sp. KJ006]
MFHLGAGVPDRAQAARDPVVGGWRTQGNSGRQTAAGIEPDAARRLTENALRLACSAARCTTGYKRRKALWDGSSAQIGGARNGTRQMLRNDRR